MGCRYYVYVDNVGVLGIVRKDTADTLKQVCAGMESIGLSMHEIEPTNEKLEPLGVELDLAGRFTRLTDK
eukprot:8447247-Karenia_brevis.AAC.1